MLFRSHTYMKQVLEAQENLQLKQAEIVGIVTEDGKVKGVKSRLGTVYNVKAAVIATGTYLGGRIHIGELNYQSGPDNVLPALELTKDLEEKGIALRRFKTGTPARVHKRSVNFDLMEVQNGDEPIMPFCFDNELPL